MANNVNITVVNNTDEDQNIVIFQQEDELNQMFDKLFPIAWKVFPIGKRVTGQTRQGRTIYPIQQAIGVVRYESAVEDGNLPVGELDITSDVNSGEKWTYTLVNDMQEMNRTGKNDDSSVSCLNNSGQEVPVAYLKNGSVIAAYTSVDNGDEAMFKLTPKLYIMYLNNIQEGDIFKSMIKGQHVTCVDLTGLSSVTATLEVDPNGTGGAKIWMVKKQ